MFQQRPMRKGLAADATNEGGGGVALALLVDVRPQPIAERLEFAAGECWTQRADVGFGLGKELRGVHVAQRIGGKIADQAGAPVDVLQYAIRVARGRDPKVLLVAI